ncbi:MAG: GGDEF domain-containing response regulator [Candidatus Anammoxibacter sp.]
MGKTTILIADGCDKTLQKLSDSFPTEDYDVIRSKNGIDVIVKSMSALPAAIVLSDDLSGMNGYHVCRLLRNDDATKSIPVIMLTSKNSVAPKHCEAENRPDEKLPKECDTKQLLKVVRQRLDGNAKLRASVTKANSSVDHADIITNLNYLLDNKTHEAEIFRHLPGIVQNIFSFDDLALSVMDIFPQIIDYSVAMIVIITDDESKLVIHLHKDVSLTSLSKIKQTANDKLREEITTFDDSKMWVKTISEDRIVDNTDTDLDEIVFSKFTNGGILKKVFLLFGNQGNLPNNNEQKLLNTVCESASIILESAWLYGKLYKNVKSLTITDGLTNIYNHKYIVGLIHREYSRSKRYKHNISMIMIDIDNFKMINDTLGHQTGDVVLREIATIIKDSTRTSDVVGRYGGEEFSVLLPETDTNDAMLFAERLRKRIESFAFFNPVDPLKITASMGVATYPLNEAEDAQSFIRCADSALYTAKDAGKNRVHKCEKSN